MVDASDDQYINAYRHVVDGNRIADSASE